MTFHKLTAWITRFVNTVLEDTSDSETGFHRKIIENRTRCNTGKELNKDLSGASECSTEGVLHQFGTKVNQPQAREKALGTRLEVNFC